MFPNAQAQILTAKQGIYHSKTEEIAADAMDSPDFPSDEEGIGFDEHDDLIDLGEPSAARGESNHGPWPIGFTDSFLEDAQEPQQQPGFVAPHVLVGPSFPRQSLDHSFPPPVDMGNAYISWEQSQYHSVSEFAPHVLDYDPRLLSMDFMCNYPEASTSGQQAAPFPVVRPPEEPMPSAALKAQLAVSIEDGKAEENMILLNRREAGVGYQQISDEILAQLGVKISTNALVKRWNKMQGLQMSVSVSVYYPFGRLSFLSTRGEGF